MTDQMSPADVHPDLVRAAATAIQAAHAGGSRSVEFFDEVRIGLATALSIHEQQVRERIAADLRAVTFRCPTHNGRLAFNDGCIGCQRYAALVGAVRVVAGRESPSVKAVREMRAGASSEGDE